ncbi:MAG: hypothetical protein GXO87_08490 [Chlorobi bacterium]|nr:hypothetical protein [Chlorobiota bacterium]
MSSDNKNVFQKPLKIVVYVILILFAVSFLPKDQEIAGIQIKYVDILSDLKPSDEGQNSEETEKIKSENIQSDDGFIDPDYVAPDTSSDDGFIDPDYVEPDTSSEDGFIDPDYVAPDTLSMNEKMGKMQVSSASFGFIEYFYEKAENLLNGETAKNDALNYSSGIKLRPQPITGNVAQLKGFFKALKNSKKKQVRIAHYGDSIIEGDLITADFRQRMQSKFGGKGVGFLSITSQDIQFRVTTKQSFSKTWKTGSIFANNSSRLPIGIAGTVNVPKGKSWVEFKASRNFRTVKTFTEARLFYSDAKKSSITYSFKGGKSGKENLRTGKGLHETVLRAGRTVSELKIEFPEKEQAYFYGVSLESGNGVYVDNFPLRGNSGVDIQKIDDALLKSFSKKMNYQLIILQFGLNAAGTAKSDFSWYEREMVKVINKLKKDFPKAGILLIAVEDKSEKKGTQFITDPVVLKLLEAQKNIVRKTKVAFWNLFESMGGKNSMPKWVNSNPPLAFKDYTHFNGQGAKKVAEMLADALLQAYKKYGK